MDMSVTNTQGKNADAWNSFDNSILRIKSLSVYLDVPKSTIYLWVSQGEFPAPVKLGARAVGWIKREVDQWLESRAKTR